LRCTMNAMQALRARWRSLALTTGALVVIALGVATSSKPASATSCKSQSSRIRLLAVTEDGTPGTTANYDGLVLLIGRETGTLEVIARPESSDTAMWIEPYHVATPTSP